MILARHKDLEPSNELQREAHDKGHDKGTVVLIVRAFGLCFTFIYSLQLVPLSILGRARPLERQQTENEWHAQIFILSFSKLYSFYFPKS